MPVSNSAKPTQGANTGGLNLAGLGEDDENEEEELQIPDDIEVEVPAEERYKVLLRQVDMQLNTFGAGAESGAAAGKAGVSATQVDMKTLISLATPNERCMLLTGWIFSALTGFVIPSFIFMLGPVFDAFNPNASKEESLKQVGMLVALMGGLALFVWIAAYMSYYLQQKGATRAVRHIKRAYFESVLRQESAWFDQISYSQLATNIAADCSQIEQGIGQKFGALVQAYGMSISGMFLAFLKGWSLALPMLLLVPILSCGLKILIKNLTAKFVISATAFAAAAAACDEAMSAIRIVVAFGME
jgi:ABC-type multidrug transport system fused ATPase/permease subunit|mmetsp:Transcript_24402/g.32669  ORF Transcript_24402/g.32669 Transcript_24402/m.32669 type:complete len:302 (+) Transcript_24402:111-1016(+)